MTRDIYEDSWINAQEMHQKYPDKFIVPSHNEIKNLNKGDLVKVCNRHERFWTMLIQNEKNGYWIAEVKNDLVDVTLPYAKMDSCVRIHIDNIYTITYQEN